MAPLLPISIAPNEVTPLSTKTAASILHFTSRLVVFSISKVLLLVDVPVPTEMDIEPSSMPLSEIWPRRQFIGKVVHVFSIRHNSGYSKYSMPPSLQLLQLPLCVGKKDSLHTL
ncbi:hypothetical protein Syun_006954 [Stephania yunnanensis]|uniref:Uncharacterized protein n=1 Tax=Stephania yunnanensis TaxID=152371 RepID=A0AAP0PY58_9MAGN